MIQDSNIQDSDRSAASDRIDIDDPQLVTYWAERWGVQPLAILNAIRKVGPMKGDIWAEVKKDEPNEPI